MYIVFAIYLFKDINEISTLILMYEVVDTIEYANIRMKVDQVMDIV